MRFIIAAAAVLAVGLVTPTPSFAAAAKKDAATRASLNESFNACVELAKKRGYAFSDLEANRPAVRNFVIRCMQGKQR